MAAPPLTPRQIDELRRAQVELGADPAAAVTRLRALVAASGEQADVLHLLGGALEATGDQAGARTALLRAVALAPYDAPVHNSLGNVLSALGDIGPALSAYRRACALLPSFGDAWFNLGLTLSGAGRFDEAIAALDRAIAIDPRAAKAISAKGDALRGAGDLAAAIEAYRQALAIDPDRGITLLNIGLAHRDDDRAADALPFLQRAEQALPRPEIAAAHAAALGELGRVGEAVAVYDRIAAQWPATFDAHRMRAQTMIEHGWPGDAYAAYASVARRFPGEPSAWSNWAMILFSHRRFTDARATVAEARRNGHALLLLDLVDAASADELGDARAGVAFENISRRASDEAATRIAFARHLLRAGDPARAAEEAERATQLAPLDQGAWAYLGTAWRLLSDPRELWLHDYHRFIGADFVATAALDPNGLAAAAAEAIRPLHIARHHPADQTLLGGTQTSGALFDRRAPAIRALRDALQETVLRFVAQLPDDPDHPFLARKQTSVAFSGSWSVRLARGGLHINHVHPSGWISSAYYLALPTSVAAGGQAGWIGFGAPPAELGLNLPPRRTIRPEVGELVLFPSSMWHGTMPFDDTAERLTVAFDAVPE